MEADMRIIVAAFTGLLAAASVAAKTAPHPDTEYWRPLGTTLSFALGDETCGQGRHQALRRDWRGDWWWGPCVPNK
jgi:hypothetical protein